MPSTGFGCEWAFDVAALGMWPCLTDKASNDAQPSELGVDRAILDASSAPLCDVGLRSATVIAVASIVANRSRLPTA